MIRTGRFMFSAWASPERRSVSERNDTGGVPYGRGVPPVILGGTTRGSFPTGAASRLSF